MTVRRRWVSGSTPVGQFSSPSLGLWRDPSVLDRRRIEIVDSESPGGVQPYHAAAQLDLGEADKLVRASAARATLMAIEAIGGILDRLRAEGYIVCGCGILLASGRPLADLAVTLKSHALIHAAEGQHFRQAIGKAAEHHKLRITGVKERDLLDRASTDSGASPEELAERLAKWGRQLGPPWRQDEKYASLIAWLALAAAEVS